MSTEDQPQRNPLDTRESPALSDDDKRLADEYLLLGIPLDRLAYTSAFDDMYERLQAAGEKRAKVDVWRRLLTLRKSGRLPRVA